jgi:hypothetical protein
VLLTGSGRSGSTLIERALGGVPGVTALGETVHLWERGLRDDELCSCEQPFSACTFWSRVGKTAFGGWDEVDPADLSSLRAAVVRTRYLPAMLVPTPRRPWHARRDRLAATVGALMHAAQEVSGARVLLDSSKIPVYAGLLRHADVDLRCVHVVRDPRGVAHSLAKNVERPEVTGGGAAMYRLSPVRAGLWWSAFELQATVLAAASTPMTTVRYEDFVDDPAGVVSRILTFAGLRPDPSELDHLRPGAVDLSAGHLVAGNPMRFRTGPAALRSDEAWRTGLPTRDRRAVELLTAGWRHRHGYR